MIVVAIICIIIFGICFLTDKKRQVVFNNEQSYQELITYKYDSNEFYSLRKTLDSGNEIALFDVIAAENIECVRKIEDIRYLILLSEMDEKLFVFFDADFKVTGSYYVKDDFLNEDDFASVQTGITQSSLIFEMDQNRIFYPFNTDFETGHITKEGLVIISYNRMGDEEILNDPVVESIEFYNNDEILKMREDNFFIQFMPYILPIDKQEWI